MELQAVFTNYGQISYTEKSFNALLDLFSGDVDETETYLISSDMWEPMECKRHEVRSIELPEWFISGMEKYCQRTLGEGEWKSRLHFLEYIARYYYKASQQTHFSYNGHTWKVIYRDWQALEMQRDRSSFHQSLAEYFSEHGYLSKKQCKHIRQNYRR